MSGPIALVGGNEFREPARDLDAWLLQRSGGSTVWVLPTAAAHSRPDIAVATARAYFSGLGADVVGVMVLNTDDASSRTNAAMVRDAGLLYLTVGDPELLAGVLRGSAVWEALVDAHERGVVVAGSSAGAMVLVERMLLGSSFGTRPGLGLVAGPVVLPHHNRSSPRIRARRRIRDDVPGRG